ncbi:MAG: DUF4097 family beta strand repeat-containing protein [Bacillota bacterium]
MRKIGVGRLTLGLVLALLGISLLLDLNYGYSTLETVVRYWPAVLILLGLEYLLVARDPESSARLSFGAVLALIILVFLATAYVEFPGFVGFADFGWSFPGQEQYTIELPVDEQFGAEMSRLDIEAVHDVIVRGTDGDRVQGTARLTVRARTANEAKRVAEQIRVVGRPSGSTLYIEIDRPDDASKLVSIQPSFELSMPRRGNLESETISGDTEISGITGDVSIKSISGKIVLDDKPSSVRADLISGDLQMTLNPDMKTARVKTISGDVLINVPPGTGGNLDFSSVSGSLDFTSVSGTPGSSSGIRTTTNPGRRTATGSFGTGSTDVDINTVSGDAVIR